MVEIVSVLVLIATRLGLYVILEQPTDSLMPEHGPLKNCFLLLKLAKLWFSLAGMERLPSNHLRSWAQSLGQVLCENTI